MRITLIQDKIYWADISANLSAIEVKLEKLNGTIDLVVLPEMFNTGFTNNVNKCAETFDGKTVSWMKFIAKKTDTASKGEKVIKEKFSQ